MAKYVYFTGGVASGIGKGVAAASLGAVLEGRGLSTTIIKLDPYINVDAGTMSPGQHGEVYVTADGAETDLDLGHYERLLNRQMGRRNNCTAGQIYDRVISRERQGGYLGATVQVIPHITDEIKAAIRAVADGLDIVIVEIGGTVGDIESQPFLEAIRQLLLELGPGESCVCHLTLVPYVTTAGEFKTKPTQHSVRELREIGIQPDLLLCRSEQELLDVYRQKIGLFANLPADRVFSAADVDLIYEIPAQFASHGVDAAVCQTLRLEQSATDLKPWKSFVAAARGRDAEVVVGMVGKYGNPSQSYKSLMEALAIAGIKQGLHVRVEHLDLDELVASGGGTLAAVDAVLVPGAFGERGTAGKLLAIEQARLLKKPYLGICAGMQLAIIEYARSCAGLDHADSVEFAPGAADPVIHLERSQNGAGKGGTMRLGASDCELAADSRLREIYGREVVSERHRHRYEFNNDYRERLEKAGLVFSAWSPGEQYCEAVELPASEHPWFIATQFHPEYTSVPLRDHPLFHSFIAAARQAAGS